MKKKYVYNSIHVFWHDNICHKIPTTSLCVCDQQLKFVRTRRRHRHRRRRRKSTTFD